jgi:hypothetical protein
MSRIPAPVDDALERWQRDGLLSAAQAETLRGEARAHEASAGRWAFQYPLAVTGGLLVLIAAGVFADWIWPRLGETARSLILVAVGLGVHQGGLLLEPRRRWRPASYLLQTAGLLVVLGALAFSESHWPDLSGAGIAVGVAALVIPMLFVFRSVGRDPFMPAVHLSLGFAFLALFLDRATPLTANQICWTLDGVLLLVAGALVLQLSGARADDSGRGWALNAFVAALYVGFVLVLLTAMGPLQLDRSAVWPVDAWLAVVTALTLWAIHRAPPALQREWFEAQLALCVVYAIPLGFYTVKEALRGSAEAATVVVGGVGAAAMSYALAREDRRVLVAGCLAVLSAAWYYGVTRGGALGAVAALAATAALLFWLSARLGRRS